MKKKKSIPQKGKKKKRNWYGIFMTVFTIILFAGAFAWMGYNIYHQESEEQMALEKYKATFPEPGKIIEHKVVCMASNVYMGKEQLEVIINGKTYYSCSPHCTNQLQSQNNVRLATDPLSKKTIDKADAFISMSPDSVGAILYFESNENMKHYSKQ
jgi:YHS domain-containing protein